MANGFYTTEFDQEWKDVKNDLAPNYGFIKYRIGNKVPSAIFSTITHAFVSFKQGSADKLLVFNNLFYRKDGTEADS
jgi:hypothetical protein